MAERTNATVLKTVRPFTGSRGFKSHSLRQMPLSLEKVVDDLYGMNDGDAEGLEGFLKVKNAAWVGCCHLSCAAALNSFYFAVADGDSYLWMGEGVRPACAAAHALIV